MHVTAIRHKVQEQRYINPVISTLTIALDEEEIKACTIDNDLYLCAPGMVKNMETKPNRALGELYNRHQRKSCLVVEVTNKQIIWKELMMPNAWLFAANVSIVTEII